MKDVILSIYLLSVCLSICPSVSEHILDTLYVQRIFVWYTLLGISFDDKDFGGYLTLSQHAFVPHVSKKCPAVQNKLSPYTLLDILIGLSSSV